MTHKLKKVMLVDDNPHDNFFHEIAVKEYSEKIEVMKFTNPEKALQYLSNNINDDSMLPDVIFLDINMPRMNGWEFLEEFNKIVYADKKTLVMVMLSTSDDPLDIHRANSFKIVSGFKTKPLTQEMLDEIVRNHFA